MVTSTKHFEQTPKGSMDCDDLKATHVYGRYTDSKMEMIVFGYAKDIAPINNNNNSI